MVSCYFNQNSHKAKGSPDGLYTGAINGRSQMTSKKLIKWARGNKIRGIDKYGPESQNNLIILHILRSELPTILIQGLLRMQM